MIFNYFFRKVTTADNNIVSKKDNKTKEDTEIIFTSNEEINSIELGSWTS